MHTFVYAIILSTSHDVDVYTCEDVLTYIINGVTGLAAVLLSGAVTSQLSSDDYDNNNDPR